MNCRIRHLHAFVSYKNKKSSTKTKDYYFQTLKFKLTTIEPLSSLTAINFITVPLLRNITHFSL